MEYMWAIWLGVFVIALAVEALGTELVSIWFALGAIVSLIISFIPGVQWWIQLIVFFVVSVATLLALRPILHRFMKRDIVSSNIDELIHKKGVVITPIDNMNCGEVKLGSNIWRAISSSEECIAKDAVVEILAIEGNKLIVSEVK